MTQAISLAPDSVSLTTWLNSYQQSRPPIGNEDLPVIVSGVPLSYVTEQLIYELPLAKLYLLNVTLYLSHDIQQIDIERARKDAIKSALRWQKSGMQHNKTDEISAYYVLALDIYHTCNGTEVPISNHDPDSYHQISKNKGMMPLSHQFGAPYFLEDFIIDSRVSHNILIYSEQDWQTILTTLKNPCDLVHFFRYHAHQLQISGDSGNPSFDSEQMLLNRFMSSENLFSQAITIDNALINHKLQSQPNAALVAMSLVQKSQNATAPMYQQHRQQAAVLWEQLIYQIIETNADNTEKTDKVNEFKLWQQQLLDESLFSRHELVRVLYKHPKQTLAMQQSGYVIHQHSYASFGRHYVLIFYGKAANSPHSKALIKPRLQQIAQDVAARLPLVELHHIMVLGVDFIEQQGDTYIEIDAWIQPTIAMSQRERQLTRQLQALYADVSQKNNGGTERKPTSFHYPAKGKYSQ